MPVLFVICVLVGSVLSLPTPSNFLRETNYVFPFVSRAGWGALPSTDEEPMNIPVPYVVIHHTYIPGACNTTSECSQAMRSMQVYHNSLEWGDIGYNFCVGGDGSTYEGRGWEVKGIHATKANSISLGICLIGDWREQLPPKGQLEATKALIRAGVQRGAIKKDYKLVGHRQVTTSECPGDALYHEISTWKHYVPIDPSEPLTSRKETDKNKLN